MLITSSIRCLQSEANAGIAVGSEQVLRPYDRECLLSLRRRAAPEPGLLDYVPEELLKRPRKRGRRGGIKHRLRRRCNKPPLPSILFSNVRSLRNKVEELRLNTRILNEYRESCMMIFTETWLQEDFPDSLVQCRESLFAQVCGAKRRQNVHRGLGKLWVFPLD
ncbi:hypothetical protein JOQ06_009743 [Pogonophryne albipinna]|uniref:Uncharacterized protein n=1 Tax=Pogonophryne albipinna TaxID=1090488 RepID=A0AAD6BRH0_9TELE|nr:hypothetical protein JOQ06_009743 [Pogonophryne albipinna]